MTTGKGRTRATSTQLRLSPVEPSDKRDFKAAIGFDPEVEPAWTVEVIGPGAIRPRALALAHLPSVFVSILRLSSCVVVGLEDRLLALRNDDDEWRVGDVDGLILDVVAGASTIIAIHETGIDRFDFDLNHQDSLMLGLVESWDLMPGYLRVVADGQEIRVPYD